MPRLDTMDRHVQRAFDMLNSATGSGAFDLAQEPAAVRERYGLNPHGQSVLQARRLVERGVPLVTVFWPSDGIKNVSVYWDTHNRNFVDLKERLMPPADQALFGAARRSGRARHAGRDAGRLDRRIRPHAASRPAQQRRRRRPRRPRSLARLLHHACWPAAAFAAARSMARRIATRPIPPRTPWRRSTWWPRSITCWASPEHLALRDAQGRPLVICPGTPIASCSREAKAEGCSLDKQGRILLFRRQNVPFSTCLLNSRSARRRSSSAASWSFLAASVSGLPARYSRRNGAKFFLPSASALAAATSGARSAILLRSTSNMLCGGCCVAGVMSSIALSLSFSTENRAIPPSGLMSAIWFLARSSDDKPARPASGASSDDLVVGQVQRRQLGHRAQRLQGLNLVVREIQILQLVQLHQRRQVRDLVLRQAQRLQAGQALDRRQVADLVVRQVEQQQVGALFQPGQILNLASLGLERRDLAQIVVGQLFDVGLLFEDQRPQGRFQVLVGKHDGPGRPQRQGHEPAASKRQLQA